MIAAISATLEGIWLISVICRIIGYQNVVVEFNFKNQF